MNVERLSSAWPYPAICHPVFNRPSIEGLSSAAGETVAEKTRVAIPATAIRKNASTVERHRCCVRMRALFSGKADAAIATLGGNPFGPLDRMKSRLDFDLKPHLTRPTDRLRKPRGSTR